ERGMLKTDTSVDSLAFAPDGNTIVGCCYDSTVRLWEVAGNGLKERARFTNPEDGVVSSPVFTPDGNRLAFIGSKHTAWLWELSENAKAPKDLPLHLDGAHSLRFAPDGKTLAVGGRDETVRLWDLSGAAPKEKAVLRAPRRRIFSMAFSRDGDLLAAGTA